MHTASISIKKVIGLDYRVWITMLLTWLACLGLFGYKKIKQAQTIARPCAEARIIVNGTDTETIAVCYLNRIATLRLQGLQSLNVEFW
jgi:hypothetical protein